jgi:hypothetical protein
MPRDPGLEELVKSSLGNTRGMSGWVRATPEAYGNDATRQKLIAAALHFTGSLPKKKMQ